MNKPYVKLDKHNAAVLLVDHQAGLSSLVRDIEPDKFRNNVLALAALAALPLAGMLKRPAKPVSVTAMNRAIRRRGARR